MSCSSSSLCTKNEKPVEKFFSLWKKLIARISFCISTPILVIIKLFVLLFLLCVVRSEWQLTPQWIAPRRPSYLFQWQMKQMKSVSSVIEKTFLSVNCKKQCFVKVQFSHSVSQRQYWWDFLFFRIAFNVLLGNRPCRSFYSGKKGDCIVFKH